MASGFVRISVLRDVMVVTREWCVAVSGTWHDREDFLTRVLTDVRTARRRRVSGGVTCTVVLTRWVGRQSQTTRSRPFRSRPKKTTIDPLSIVPCDFHGRRSDSDEWPNAERAHRNPASSRAGLRSRQVLVKSRSCPKGLPNKKKSRRGQRAAETGGASVILRRRVTFRKTPVNTFTTTIRRWYFHRTSSVPEKSRASDRFVPVFSRSPGGPRTPAALYRFTAAARFTAPPGTGGRRRDGARGSCRTARARSVAYARTRPGARKAATTPSRIRTNRRSASFCHAPARKRALRHAERPITWRVNHSKTFSVFSVTVTFFLFLPPPSLFPTDTDRAGFKCEREETVPTARVVGPGPSGE